MQNKNRKHVWDIIYEVEKYRTSYQILYFILLAKKKKAYFAV